MTVVYMSEEPDHPGFAKAEYKIGDRVKVTKITLTENDADDTREAFLNALGNSFDVQEVNLWETTNPEDPWHVTYHVDVGKMDSIFLNADEVIKV